MSGPKTRLPACLPWSVRLFATAPLPTAVSALLAFGAITAAFTAYCRIRGIPLADHHAGIELLQLAMIALTPAATVYALRGAERDLADLAPLLRPEAEREGAGLERVLLIGRTTLAVTGTAGAAIGIGLLLDPGSWVDGVPASEHPIFLWAAPRSAAL